jgi:hypothetical protein
MITPTRLDAARTFTLQTARLIDRHRFAYHFGGGSAESVLAALLAYRNPDGGFGHALEPDGRGAASQPATAFVALRVLDEIGRCQGPTVTALVDYLQSVSAPDGGVPVMLPSAATDPRAPWWNPPTGEPAGTLLPTAAIVGLLRKNGIVHPWLEAATAFCWKGIAAIEETHPYEVEFCLPFLDHAPERERAEREAIRLGELVREQRLVLLDPNAPDEVRIPPGYAPGERHTPLDYASRPASLARRWFSDQQIERALDALEQAQSEDGGWWFNWGRWNDATTLESRGWKTVDILEILRAYGRIA